MYRPRFHPPSITHCTRLLLPTPRIRSPSLVNSVTSILRLPFSPAPTTLPRGPPKPCPLRHYTTDQNTPPKPTPPRPSFYCEECDKHFAHKQGLIDHLTHSSNHAGQQLNCHICNEPFPSLPALREHRISAHHDAAIWCEECGSEFWCQKSLSKHKLTKHGNSDFRCDECDRYFVGQNDLDQHLRLSSEHASQPLEDSEDPEDPFTPSPFTIKLRCDKCDKTFPNRRILNKHNLIKHGTNFRCIPCGKSFIDQHGLDEHLMFSSKHVPKPVPENTSSPTKFPCAECNSIFDSEKRLKKHHIAKHQDPKFHCKDCNRFFLHWGGLDSHLRFSPQHHSQPTDKPQDDPTPQLTPETSSEPTTSSTPTTSPHLPSATQLSFACPQCKKCYYDKETLDKHLITRNHAAEFLCDTCEERFPDQYALDQHLVSPRHLMTFYCDECESSFSTFEELERHHVGLHMRRGFMCGVCGREFGDQFELDEHEERRDCGEAVDQGGREGSSLKVEGLERGVRSDA